MSAGIFRDAEANLWRVEGVQPTERNLLLEKLGINIRIQEVGEGQPVLFLHGGPGASGSIWASLVARLHGLRCVLVDGFDDVTAPRRHRCAKVGLRGSTKESGHVGWVELGLAIETFFRGKGS